MFSGVIKYLVAPEGVAVAEKSNSLIITKLTAFEMLTVSNKVANAETILMSVGEIVRFESLNSDNFEFRCRNVSQLPLSFFINFMLLSSYFQNSMF